MAGFGRVIGWSGVGLAVAGSIIQITDSQSYFHKQIVLPAVHKLDPETAHKTVLKLLSLGLGPRDTSKDDEKILSQTIWDRKFVNPIGLAAGFDKDAVAIKGLLQWGFGFVEIGSVTPLPQPGNDKPRLFRLSEDQGIINRFGFNNEGMIEVGKRLSQYRREQSQYLSKHNHSTTNKEYNGILGINIGKNKIQTNAIEDYIKGLNYLGPHGDYLVINVSSPNTPGLRSLQNKSELSSLIKSIIQERDKLLLLTNNQNKFKSLPILLKIAPDLSDEELGDVADVCIGLGVDGVIVSNTTISRPETLLSEKNLINQTGGLSGKPILNISTERLKKFYQLTNGKIPLIGVGGVLTAEDAYLKIRNGASLVQVYSGLIYNGPAMVPEIKEGLTELLKKDGFQSVTEAIGVDAWK